MNDGASVVEHRLLRGPPRSLELSAQQEREGALLLPTPQPGKQDTMNPSKIGSHLALEALKQFFRFINTLLLQPGTDACLEEGAQAERQGVRD